MGDWIRQKSTSGTGVDSVELTEEAPKVPLVIKQEQSEQEPLPEGELQ